MHKNRTLHLIKNMLLASLLLICSFNTASLDATKNTIKKYNWPQIIQQLEKTFSRYPNSSKTIDSLSNAYNNYGLEFANKSDWQQAENYLKKALEIKPSSEEIKHNLSNVYFAHGLDVYQNQTEKNYQSVTHTQAKQLALLALSLYRKNTNAYILLGDIEYINQRMRAAQQNWKQAALLAPENQEVQDRLAKITREANTESIMSEKYNPFFIIKIEPSLENIPGFDINEVLNYARSSVSRDFNYKQTSKVPVIIYNSEQYKKTLTNAPIWSEGAYDGKLRIIMSTNPKLFNQVKSTIIHEYTHSVIYALTRGKCPLWLNEGIAKYEEYKHGVPPLINYLALAHINKNVLAWNEINDSFKSKKKSQVLLAYQQSFSFVYYIVKRYGMKKLITLLTSLADNPDFPRSFSNVYGISLEKAQNNWRLWFTNYLMTWSQEKIILPY